VGEAICLPPPPIHISIFTFPRHAMARARALAAIAATICAVHPAHSASAGGAAPTPLPAAVISARAEASLLGGVVGDAAVMGLHWIYDTNEIKRLVG
jgi:hypothetical protein